MNRNAQRTSIYLSDYGINFISCAMLVREAKLMVGYNFSISKTLDHIWRKLPLGVKLNGSCVSFFSLCVLFHIFLHFGIYIYIAMILASSLLIPLFQLRSLPLHTIRLGRPLLSLASTILSYTFLLYSHIFVK